MSWSPMVAALPSPIPTWKYSVRVLLVGVRLAYDLTTASAIGLLLLAALVLLGTILLFAFATRHGLAVRREPAS